jgi:putative endonuclease
MYFVYLLKSKKTAEIYTGYTTNLDKRIKRHSSGLVQSTKRMIPFELIYFEAFKSRLDAQRREKYLKSTKGKRTIKLMLKYSLV